MDKKNLVVHKVIAAVQMFNTKTFRGTTDSQLSANKMHNVFFLDIYIILRVPTCFHPHVIDIWEQI
jgi:hypothetical protein